MRKVKFENYSKSRFNTQTGCYDDVVETEGLFHGWYPRAEYNDFGATATSTIALIELHDGTMAEVYPTDLTFLDLQSQKEVE